jgi:hypothetical protein
MTSRARWRNQTITDRSAAGHVNVSTDRRRSIPEAEDERPWRQARVARREVSSGALAKEAGMATRDQPGDGWTVVLRRRPARIVAGRPEGGYTDTFKIICGYCGDHPDLDYCEVAPELQRIRGSYPIAAGVAAYEKHVGLHQQPEAAHRPGTMTMLADWL